MHKLIIKHKFVLLVFILVVSGILIWFILNKPIARSSDQPSNVVNTSQTSQNSATKPKKLKIFTGQEFKNLYNSIAYPNTEYINEDTVITGNPDSDQHIQKLAENKGYKRRSAPVSDNFMSVSTGLSLQQKAYQPWLDMVYYAKENGLTLDLVDAYRSSSDSRKLFLDRLTSYKINTSLIASGIYDNQINNVLKTTAIPGYSRHHTGYTVDIGCNGQSEAVFKYTQCFSWLSEDNYKNAKTYGWIPSYPDGAGEQGPDPEPWEYVWVGINATFE